MPADLKECEWEGTKWAEKVGVAGGCSAMDSEMLIFILMTKMTMEITTCNPQCQVPSGELSFPQMKY